MLKTVSDTDIQDALSAGFPSNTSNKIFARFTRIHLRYLWGSLIMRLVLFRKVAGQLLQSAVLFILQCSLEREVSKVHYSVIFLPANDRKVRFDGCSFGKGIIQTTADLLK